MKITKLDKNDLLAICVIVPVIIFLTANLVNKINERTIADSERVSHNFTAQQ